MQEQAISINPNVMSGVPVFAGTRVPIYSLFDYVLTGETIDSFIDDFPTVSKEQAMKVIPQLILTIDSAEKGNVYHVYP